MGWKIMNFGFWRYPLYQLTLSQKEVDPIPWFCYIFEIRPGHWHISMCHIFAKCAIGRGIMEFRVRRYPLYQLTLSQKEKDTISWFLYSFDITPLHKNILLCHNFAFVTFCKNVTQYNVSMAGYYINSRNKPRYRIFFFLWLCQLVKWVPPKF